MPKQSQTRRYNEPHSYVRLLGSIDPLTDLGAGTQKDSDSVDTKRGAVFCPLDTEAVKLITTLPEAVRNHSVGVLAGKLAQHLGMACDAILLIELLSLLAGRMGMGINLDIVTPDLTADLFIANRVLQLAGDKVRRINSLFELQIQESSQFDNVWLVLLRGSQPKLFRDATEIVTRLLDSQSFPCIWRIAEKPPIQPGLGPTLRLLTGHAERDFKGFAEHFTAPSISTSAEDLAALLEEEWPRPTCQPKMRERLRCPLRPEEKLTVERLLTVISAVRIKASEYGSKTSSTPPSVTEPIAWEDYACLRSLLVHLPIPKANTQLTPEAAQTAETIYHHVHRQGYQNYLPEVDQHHQRWFTRCQATDWTRKSYNTVKAHLEQMEAEGLLRATQAENAKQRGKQIHYRFLDGISPPFVAKNPFTVLPEAIAPECC